MNHLGRISAALAAMVIGTALLVAPSTAETVVGPVLHSTTPANGASVREAPTISATYNMNLHHSSTLVLQDRTGDPIRGSTTVQGPTITFTPSEPITEAGSPYTATATVRDAATGTLETTSTWSFSVDVTAPPAPVIQAVEGDDASPALGNDPTPAIVVSGVAEGDTVTISEGGTALGSKVVPAGADSVTFNRAEGEAEVTVTGDGDHTLSAAAKDRAGNTSGASTGFVYTLDTTPPAVPAIASVEGDTTSPAAGNDPTPTVVVSGVVAGDTVTVSEGGTVLGSKAVAGGADTVTFNPAEGDADVTVTGDGNHTLVATATDAAGNTSTASAGFVYTLDTTPPAAPTIASVEGDTTSPAAGNDPTPTIVVTGVVAGDTVTISEGGTVVAFKVVPGGDTVTFNADEADVEVNLTVGGEHTLTATATDPVGNASAPSASFLYHLDTGDVGPTLVSNEPDGSMAVRPPATVSATYDEPLDQSSSTLTVRNQVGNVVAGTISFSADARTITFRPSSSFTEAGSPYAVTAEVRDVNANPTSTTWSFTVDTTAPGAPTIASVNGDTTAPAVGNDPTPAIVVSGVVAGDTVTISEGGTVLAFKVVPDGADTVTLNAGEADAEVTLSGHRDHTLVAFATDPAGNISAASAGFVYTLVSFEGTFHPLSPARILDTRTGNGAPQAKVGPGKTVALQATGRGGVPTTGVTAVVMNVTVTQPTASSVLTVWPSGEPQPNASNLNYVAGQTVPNLVVVKVGAGGKVDLRNFSGSTHVIADVVGWYSDNTVATSGARYQPLSPARILDTREGNGAPKAKLGPGDTISVQATGRGGVPSTGVSAVVMNVTVTQPTASSVLTAWPSGEPQPNASNLNYVAGQTVPNLVVVKVGTGGKVSLRNFFGATHVIADVVGWYSDQAATTGARYQPLSPSRILDTREGNGAPTGKVSGTISVQATGRGGVPATGVSAVVMNVTVTQPTASSVLTVWPSGEPQPNASNLNYVAGQTVPNLVVVKVGTGGKVNLRNYSGSTHVVADVVGWYGTE